MEFFQLSPDGKYSYFYSYSWDSTKENLLWICINPSIVVPERRNATVRRIVDFTFRWNYGGFAIVNLFAYRTTSPQKLLKIKDPIGPDNDSWIDEYLKKYENVVCAWGNHGSHLGRGEEILKRVSNAKCFGYTKSKNPLHPLRIPHYTHLIEIN
jgi:hypothetical protein